MYNLKNKVALVTGAGGQNGMGKAIALRLAKEGANVVVNDIKVNTKDTDKWSGLPDVVKEIKSLGQKSFSLEGDVSDSIQVDNMIEEIVHKFGSIDILVNNAATSAGADRVPIVELNEDVWDLVLKVNLKGTFLCCKAVAKVLIKQGRGGKIINMSSVSGKYGVPKFGAYCASKFAVRGFTQVLAKELGVHGIQVNAICPGFVVTERTEDIAKALAPEGTSVNEFIEKEINQTISNTPLGRVCKTNDIAQMAAFLASSESDFITGMSLTVDGGKTTE